MISRKMGIAVATAEVYKIDSFAANVPLDEMLLARYLGIGRQSFATIKAVIQGCKDERLRSVKDELEDE